MLSHQENEKMKDAAVKAVPGVSEIEAALVEYRRAADHVGGCGDGGCVVKRPIGQHTNGGCRCSTDRMKAQRMMMAGNRLSRALSAALPLASVEQAGRSSAEPVAYDAKREAMDFYPPAVDEWGDDPEQQAKIDAKEVSAALPGDLFSHKDAWRRGLVRLRDTAEVVQPDIDDRSYWQHELDIFDAVFAALASGNDLRKRVVGNPYKANAEFREDTP